MNRRHSKRIASFPKHGFSGCGNPFRYRRVPVLPLLSRRVGQRSLTFPDPTSSPPRHTRTLPTLNPQLISAADVDISTFLVVCGFVHSGAHTGLSYEPSILVPFNAKILPLHLSFVSLPDSEIFDFTRPPPLLEELILVTRIHGADNEGRNAPSHLG